jgi:hypothetical protein
MNELDLIRSFRSDVPAPSAAASARAERAWRRPEPRRPRWAPRAAAAGALVAAATAAALILPGEQNSRLGAPDAAAAQTLRRAAAAQHGGLTRPLRPGEYWYIRRSTVWGASSTGSNGAYTVLFPQLREDWVGIDGARRWLTRPAGAPRFPGPRDRRRWEAAGGPDRLLEPEYHGGPTHRRPFTDGAHQVTYSQLLQLPRDPQALYEHLRATAVECDCGQSVDSETFEIARDLLRDTPIPADLRAALLRAAALIPGIKLIQHERDVAGRPGIGVAFDYGSERSVLIFDRATYELLGENQRALERTSDADAAPGQLIGGSADLESAIVSSITERP